MTGGRFVHVVERDHEGYLAIHSLRNGFSFGGLRIDSSVEESIVKDLAETMELKLSGHGGPMGGAKGGIRASPDDPRLPEFLATFGRACKSELMTCVILGKDMGAEQWMLDVLYGALGIPQLAIAKARGHSASCPDRISELNGYRRRMTGLGVYWATKAALGGRISGTRVAIQGFGVVGAGVAYHLSGAGAVIVGASDKEKAVVCHDGLSGAILSGIASSSRLVPAQDLPTGAKLIPRDALLELEADVLVLAAGSHVIDCGIADRIRTPLIVEAANVAIEPDARDRLHIRNVSVVPDIVAGSSSAALVAHQIASGNRRDPESLWDQIQRSIEQNALAAVSNARRMGVNSRDAFRRILSDGSGLIFDRELSGGSTN